MEAIAQVKTTLHKIPRSWWVPRGDRLALAIISTLFWGFTIIQAWRVPAHGASVFSLFGLGLLYVLFSLSNLFGGLQRSLTAFWLQPSAKHKTQAASLLQLFAVLACMALCNALVLVVYWAKGTHFTMLDTITAAADVALVAVLVAQVKPAGLYRNPMARGWLAIAGKTVPQFATAGLFIAAPQTASGLALVSLIGINALSSLRFIPTLRAFRRDQASAPLRGLLLGESGNVISGACMSLAWIIAMVRL